MSGLSHWTFKSERGLNDTEEAGTATRLASLTNRMHLRKGTAGRPI